MKKIIVLFLSLTVISVQMKANSNDSKYPYVNWTTTVPDAKATPIATHVQNLKAAMQGQAIAGATVYGNAAAYKAVWGETVYNQVLAADPSRFHLTYSKGGETNYGMTADGKTVATGTLPANVPTISLDNMEIAKYGSNGCFNALPPTQLMQPSYDPDEIAFKPGQTGPGNGQPNAGITISVNGGGTNNQDLSMYKMGINDGVTVFTAGMTAAAYQQTVATANLISAQNAKQCCGATTPTQPVMTSFATTTPVVSQPTVPVYAASYATGQPQTVVVNKGPSWGKLFSANAAGTLVGGLAEDVVERVIWRSGSSNYSYSNNNDCLNCGTGGGGRQIHIVN